MNTSKYLYRHFFLTFATSVGIFCAAMFLVSTTLVNKHEKQLRARVYQFINSYLSADHSSIPDETVANALFEAFLLADGIQSITFLNKDHEVVTHFGLPMEERHQNEDLIGARSIRNNLFEFHFASNII